MDFSNENAIENNFFVGSSTEKYVIS